MAQAQFAKDIPAPIAASLGRMIARFSYLEWRMAKTMFNLCGVDPKIGRIAIGAPRISDYPSRMKQVAYVVGLDLSPFPWSALEKILREVKEERDTFAHSVWLKHSKRGVYMIQDTRGSWQTASGEKISKRIHPEGRKITAQDLIALRNEIEKAIHQADDLARFVNFLLQTYVRKSSA